MSGDVAVEQGTGLGLEAILQYLEPVRHLIVADDVSEVQIVNSCEVFTERNGVQRLEPITLDPDAVYAALKRIAHECQQEIDASTWRLDCRFVGGRLAAVFPPWSPDGFTVTLRKFGSSRLTLADLVKRGTLDEALSCLLEREVLDRRNILISGASSSGKTTLVNALAGFIPESQRIICIENPVELKLTQRNVVRWEARDSVSQRQLLEESLRHHPSRIIVGEIRGAEGMELWTLLNTGHTGSLSTIHSNSARDALERFTTYVLLAGEDLPWRALRHGIASNINTVVHLAQREDGSRYVAEAIRVEGYDAESDSFRTRELSDDQPVST